MTFDVGVHVMHERLGSGVVIGFDHELVKVRFDDYHYHSETDFHKKEPRELTLRFKPASSQSSKFESVGTEIGKLVAEKNAAYGSSYAKTAAIVRLLYPDGIKLDQIDGLLFILRILDKLGRISQDAHSLNEDAYRDIAGYGILAVATNEAAK